MGFQLPNKTLVFKALKSQGATEAASIATGFGVAYTLPKIMPRQLHRLQNVVAKYIVEPNLDMIESVGHDSVLLKAMEKRGDEEKKERGHGKKKPERSPEEMAQRMERAHRIADPLTEVTLAGVGAYAAGTIAKHFVARRVELKGDYASQIVNFGVHMAALGTVATVLSPVAKKASAATSRGLQHLGADKESADRAANYTVFWKVADLTGALAGVITLLALNVERTHIR